ncbi:hypothetical protein K466DRAFT_531380 [Polyporus arcularius HHB13444]|uniref:F-box domain-containing protein n=1 Tax=Polyporus arcularius HHB13444 TaxID=1314778 RepID=A0A5C3NWK2_9APHY|nr:hypothetical protein K466DRAFT_531380 [Polyporus arcularius HHB13444]
METSSPLPDHEGLLRAEGLQGPYYGLRPLNTTNPCNSPQLLVRMDDLCNEFLSISALVNTRAPVNRLPNEILLEIFLAVQAGTEEGTSPDWPAVLLVCRHWFAVAATAPHLWRELVVSKSLNLLRTGLVRSKGLTIGVSVIKRDAVPEAATTILPHLHRLHSLSISSIHQRHKVHVASLLQHPMPVLERLDAIIEQPTSWVVNAENPSLGIRRMPLPVAKFPKLRSLTVEKIAIPPGPDAVYNQLSVLHLWGPQIRNYAMFVDILRSCPNVEDLGLELGQGGVDPNMEKVVLPRLRTVQLRGWRWFLRDILQTIVIPATVDMSIELGGPEDDAVLREQSISAILPPDYQTVLPIFSSVTEVHAQARASEDVLVAYAPSANSQSERRRLSLRMPIIHRLRGEGLEPWEALADPEGEAQAAEDPREVARSLRQLTIFSAAPVSTLHIDIEARQEECVDWGLVLGSLPLLRDVTITAQGHAPDPRGVLGALPWQRLRVVRVRRFRATPDTYKDDHLFDLIGRTLPFMAVCLVDRAQKGGGKLEELVLDLDCLDEQQWAEVEVRTRAARQIFADLVGEFEYREQQGWRDVFTYKDS